MSYFKLLPTVKYVGNEKSGCIYKVIDNEIINLSFEENLLLDKLINKCIPVEKCSEENILIIKRFLNQNIAHIFENNVFMESYKPNCEWELRGLLEQPPKLNNIYVELTNECNYNCEFCNNNNLLINNSCLSCLKWSSTSKDTKVLSVRKWEKVIDDILYMKPQKIVISGGNPLIKYNDVENIIKHIRYKDDNVKIIVTSNGSNIDDKVVTLCKEHKVILRVSVFGYDESSYNKITRESSSYKKIFECFKLLKKFNLDYEIIVTGYSDNIDKIERFCRENELDNIFLTEIERQGNEFKTILNYEDRQASKNINYWQNKKFNTCLNGKLAINVKGEIHPCPRINDVIMDINESNISDMFQEKKVDKYWRLTKSDLEICNKCAYRYKCTDCTAMELQISNKLDKSSYLCENIEVGNVNYGND